MKDIMTVTGKAAPMMLLKTGWDLLLRLWDQGRES
jgi:hypothetical protein